MRLYLFSAPLLFVSAVAAAAPPPAPNIQVPPQLTDPAFVGRLTDMTNSMSKALLDMPVGELQAAAEGRSPTAADRRRRLRDVADISPQELERQIKQARPQIEAATQTFAQALPQITRSLSDAAAQLQAVVDNMPRPYPQP